MSCDSQDHVIVKIMW